MRYSLESRDRVYVKGYGFMYFARSMSNKYSKNLLIQLKSLLQDIYHLKKDNKLLMN